MLRPLLRTWRPVQWTKNFFVLAPAVFAGALGDPTRALRAAIAFAAFCALSSAVYVLNDLLDAEADRNHPRKRLRPLAAGIVARTQAGAAGLACAVASLAIGWTVGPRLLAVLAAYGAINVA